MSHKNLRNKYSPGTRILSPKNLFIKEFLVKETEKSSDFSDFPEKNARPYFAINMAIIAIKNLILQSLRPYTYSHDFTVF